MRILHYLPGLPPVRGGGLIKYALDLMEAESEKNDVFLLIPGAIDKKRENRKQIWIRRAGKWKNIPVYRIKNPLPIPMGNGILDIEEFTLPCEENVYYEFLQDLRPDVIHVHTFMGLHKEFLEMAHKLTIPIVNTTHDYFGICPTANLVCRNKICDAPGKLCGECSRGAFSEKRLLLEQSVPYRLYRQSDFLIKLLQMDALKKRMNSMRSKMPEMTTEEEATQDDIQHDTITPMDNHNSPSEEEYARLLGYYREMFGKITYFHFNSFVTKQIYEQYLGELPGEVLFICNKSVTDKRTVHESTGKIKIGFLGGDVPFKGLRRLQKVVGKLYGKGNRQIELQIYGSLERKEYPFCKYYDAYKQEERDAVFGKMDILAVPSSWMETFGMVVLEALSYGVPVVVTDKVGAKGLIENREQPMGIILPDEDSAWEECLTDLRENCNKIKEMSRNICGADMDLNYSTHVDDMMGVYERSFDKIHK